MKKLIVICTILFSVFLVGATTSTVFDELLNDHVHTASRVYPTLANGVDVLGGAAWTLGNFVEIVPVNTITSRFDIHYLSIESLSVNEVYEIVLYACAGQDEVGRVRVTKNANLDAVMNIPIQTPIIPANCKVDAKSASESGADTVTLTVFYHTY